MFKPLAALCLVLLTWAGSAHADKRIGILVYDGVLTSDVTAPLEVFGIASRKSWFTDYQVITIGLTPAKTITTEEGLVLGVDTWVGANPELDAIITTSAYDMDAPNASQALMTLIQKTAAKGGYLASNCSGAFLLAQAGVLDGKKATTWAGGEKDLQKQFPKVNVQVDTNVVVDGNIVTSNGSLVSYQAALTLLKLLSSESKAKEVADVLQYSRFSSKAF